MNIIEHLNWFDFVIVAVIILSVVISFFRGFLREAISLITWIMGVLVALKFAPRVSELMQSFIHASTLRYLVAFIILFALVFIFGFIINMLVKRLVDVSGLGIVDRVFGIVFGAARGLIAVGVVLMFIGVTPMEDARWATTSQLASEFTPMVVWLDSFLPEQLQEVSQWVLGGTRENAAKKTNLVKTDQAKTIVNQKQQQKSN